MRREYIPNLITAFRLMLIIPILASLFFDRYRLAFWLFTLAGLTDAIDGYLARRFHWISQWGSMVDPVADKLLMISTFLMLAYIGIVPISLLLIVVLRDIIIVCGGIAYYFIVGEYEFTPSKISKCNTFFQILLIIMLMFQVSYTFLPGKLINGTIILVYITSLISLADYIVVWGLKAWLAKDLHK